MEKTKTFDNITVNGNAYVIDGMKKPVMINVSGDNVKISNFTFINSKNNQNSKSMITWSGDNGVLSNCTFAGNIAVNGGAINWMGNNALISQCIFIANTADFGGAIYVSGSNNKIIRSIFENCYGKLGYEAVYLLCGAENCNVSSCSFDNVIPVLDKRSLNLHINKSNAGNFNDLTSEIGELKPGDTLTLTRDYYFIKLMLYPFPNWKTLLLIPEKVLFPGLVMTVFFQTVPLQATVQLTVVL